MASPLPLLLLGGAAVMLMAGGKKKKKARIIEGYVPKTPPPAVKTAGPPAATASKATWIERQTALKYLDEVGVCACDPGTPDGLYGKNTKNAIRAFQTFAKIDIDGKWGPQTEDMMGVVLAELESVTPLPSPPLPPPGPSTTQPKPPPTAECFSEDPKTWPQGVFCGPDRKAHRLSQWLPWNVEFDSGYSGYLHLARDVTRDPYEYSVVISIVYPNAHGNNYEMNRALYLFLFGIRTLAKSYPNILFRARLAWPGNARENFVQWKFFERKDNKWEFVSVNHAMFKTGAPLSDANIYHGVATMIEKET